MHFSCSIPILILTFKTFPIRSQHVFPFARAGGACSSPRRLAPPSSAMSHALRSLVRTHVFHIEHCTHCGVLHVSVGPVTLRLEVGAARQLRAALGEALERLEASSSARSRSACLHN